MRRSVGKRGETFPDTLTTQGLSLWSLNIVGGEILTFPDTLTTQGLSLWCFNIVLMCVASGRERDAYNYPELETISLFPSSRGRADVALDRAGGAGGR